MNKAKLEDKILESVKNKNGGQLPDERQQQSNSAVIACALIFGIVFDFIMMIYYFVTRNIDNAYPYVAQIVIMSVGCLMASLGNKDVELPKTFLSKHNVNADKSAPAFISRIAWCALDSIVYAAIITLFDAYTDGKVTGSLISDAITAFCVFIVINVIFCEIRVHRYRKYTAMLDAEENDLDD